MITSKYPAKAVSTCGDTYTGSITGSGFTVTLPIRFRKEEIKELRKPYSKIPPKRIKK